MSKRVTRIDELARDIPPARDLWPGISAAIEAERIAGAPAQPQARQRYHKRKGMVEPVFSHLRGQQGLNRFRRRGLAKVGLEFRLHIMAYNLARAVVDAVSYTRADLHAIAGLVAGFGLAGHRAEIVVLRAACALAAFEERGSVTDGDVLRVVPMALAHRLGSHETPGIPAVVPDAHDLAVRLEAARGEGSAQVAEKKTAPAIG